MTKVIVILILLVLSTGCASVGDNSYQTSGAMIGGLAGSVIGGQVGDGYGNVAATIGGMMLGTHLGKSIGRTYDVNPSGNALTYPLYNNYSRQYPTIPNHQTYHDQMPSSTISYPNRER